MLEEIFKNLTPDFALLQNFGFIKNGDVYQYCAPIIEGQFELQVMVDKNKHISTEIIDVATQEAYILHLITTAQGSFVGQVRSEYQTILQAIAQQCCTASVFKSPQVKELSEYVNKKYGDVLEYLWPKFPNNAILRRQDNRKWYAAVLTVAGNKLGLDSSEIQEVIDLRASPLALPQLIDNHHYFAGYHMNKQHWYTIILDGSVSIEEICNRIDESYALAIK